MHRIGTLPFSIRDGAVSVLLITSQTRRRWVLPKGLAKKGESHRETGLRETFEEAGVKGIILESYPITVQITRQKKRGKQSIPVTYYPMLVNEQAREWPEQESRKRHWTRVGDATKIGLRRDVQALIEQFRNLMPWIAEAAKQSQS